PGLAPAAGLAGVVELEERRPGDQVIVAEPGEQGDVPGGRDQPGPLPGRDHGGGQVHEFAALPPRPGGDDHDPAGPQQPSAAGEDLGEPGEQVIQAVVGQVGRGPAVVVVVLVHAAALP